jgi:hypothetical protein
MDQALGAAAAAHQLALAAVGTADGRLRQACSRSRKRRGSRYTKGDLPEAKRQLHRAMRTRPRIAPGAGGAGTAANGEMYWAMGPTRHHHLLEIRNPVSKPGLGVFGDEMRSSSRSSFGARTGQWTTPHAGRLGCSHMQNIDIFEKSGGCSSPNAGGSSQFDLSEAQRLVAPTQSASHASGAWRLSRSGAPIGVQRFIGRNERHGEVRGRGDRAGADDGRWTPEYLDHFGRRRAILTTRPAHRRPGFAPTAISAARRTSDVLGRGVELDVATSSKQRR